MSTRKPSAAPAKKKARSAPEPDTLAAKLEVYERIHLEVEGLERALKNLKASLDKAYEAVFEAMRSQGIVGFRGEHLNVAVVTQRVLKITDWEQFNAYVLKHKALDLLHRRVSSTAYFDRVNNGEFIPGCVPESFLKLSFSKRKS